MKRVVFDGHGFVPTISVDSLSDYTRIILVNGVGAAGIIIFHEKDELYKNGLFEVTFSEHKGKYNYSAIGWRELLEVVKDKFTIYYL